MAWAPSFRTAARRQRSGPGFSGGGADGDLPIRLVHDLLENERGQEERSSMFSCSGAVCQQRGAAAAHKVAHDLLQVEFYLMEYAATLMPHRTTWPVRPTAPWTDHSPPLNCVLGERVSPLQ